MPKAKKLLKLKLAKATIHVVRPAALQPPAARRPHAVTTWPTRRHGPCAERAPPPAPMPSGGAAVLRAQLRVLVQTAVLAPVGWC